MLYIRELLDPNSPKFDILLLLWLHFRKYFLIYKLLARFEELTKSMFCGSNPHKQLNPGSGTVFQGAMHSLCQSWHFGLDLFIFKALGFVNE